jgi:hypothetical protein
MKTQASTAFFCAAALFAAHAASAAAPAPWRDVDEATLRGGDGERVIVPTRYRTLALDRDALMETLAQAPLEFTPDAADTASSVVLALPMPDGSSVRFRVEESPIMQPGLAAQFPEIKTYRGRGLDDATASARFGWTAAGFHAIVLAERGTTYIDPYRRGDTAHYVSFFKRDYRAPAGDTFRCLVDDIEQSAFSGPEGPPAFAPSGDTLRTYLLALATTVEYSDFHSPAVPPSKTDVMNNGIIPTLNRVNGIYERDVALRMVLVFTNMNIIYVVEPDPYTNGNGGAMLAQNQANLDLVIGDNNYDIGHVFSTGGGGVASLRVPCRTGFKARGVTGLPNPIGDPFDVDYVAHEMGHQWGGNHSFNGNAGSCAGGRNSLTAYEVGSGSTIMAYAGICGAQNLQPNSDDYFHNINFVEIQSYITNPATGDLCPARTMTGNQAPVIDAGPAFTIPSRTPFALTAAGSDPNGDPLTYNWEEFDLGPAGAGTTDNGSSPILRSFNSTSNPTRTFPKLSDILGNVTTYGEILPTTSRTMNFRVTARDNRAGGGGVDWDATTVTSVAAAGPFGVTAPNTNVTWIGGMPQTVTWAVAGTDTAPINTASVNIWLSTDGGLTFPTSLAPNVPNDGSQVVLLPNTPSTTARVMVASAGNIFFDISDVNFTIAPQPLQSAAPVSLAISAGAEGVIQPIETVVMRPSWQNIGANALIGVTGTLTNFTGPGPVGNYLLGDVNGSYGDIAVGATAACDPDCYQLAVIAPAGRPVQHWDATVLETISPTGNTKTWTLHIGDSFSDVGVGGPFFRFVETILHKNVTGGCTATTYCPTASTTRGQMAVFVLVSREPAGYAPPACATPMFADVPASSPFCRWVEELARRGVVGGCGGGNYCPASPATREQMAVFVLRTLDPALNPPACGTPVFDDVPASSPFCRWVEELVRRGVVSGCGGGNYCPTAAVTREQMSVFLTVTFGLVLYGL